RSLVLSLLSKRYHRPYPCRATLTALQPVFVFLGFEAIAAFRSVALSLL
ncbi:unnamed protein product, partial [Ascophyllum nodosum]